jgi:ferredoxin
LQTDLEIMNGLEMTDEEAEGLLAGAEHTGFYCNGCTGCKTQCRRDLPVTDLMRAYMYTYAYSDLEKGREILDEYGVESDPCKGCPGCTVTCSSGFNVAERISKVSRLKDVPEDFIT